MPVGRAVNHSAGRHVSPCNLPCPCRIERGRSASTESAPTRSSAGRLSSVNSQLPANLAVPRRGAGTGAERIQDVLAPLSACASWRQAAVYLLGIEEIWSSLVSATEIAERRGVSPVTCRHWIGRYDDFPKPIGQRRILLFGHQESMRLWWWPDVLEYLNQNDLPRHRHPPSAQTAAPVPAAMNQIDAAVWQNSAAREATVRSWLGSLSALRPETGSPCWSSLLVSSCAAWHRPASPKSSHDRDPSTSPDAAPPPAPAAPGWRRWQQHDIQPAHAGMTTTITPRKESPHARHGTARAA